MMPPPYPLSKRRKGDLSHLLNLAWAYGWFLSFYPRWKMLAFEKAQSHKEGWGKI